MTAFQAQSVTSFWSGQIAAPVDKVFPLCCPVEEYRWIPGWKCHLIHCPNDRVEEGTVFREIFSAPFLLDLALGETTWTAVVHDPEHCRLHFRLDNKHSSSLYKIEFEDDGDGGCIARLEFTYTARTRKGNRLANRNRGAKVRVMMGLIAGMLKFYCEEQRMMPFAELQKRLMQAETLSFVDRLHVGLNRLCMLCFQDRDRPRIVGA